MRRYWAWGAAVLIFFSLVSGAFSEEYSILSSSTVIGRNFGYPNGTPPAGPTPVSEVDLVLEAAVFFKNLELLDFDEGTGIDGETFFGFLAPLRLRYRPHERFTFEAGAVLGQDFGDEDELNTAEPLLRLIYAPAERLWVVAGTIFPTHWIHDAMLDDVQKYRLNAEQGIQFRADFNRFKHDTWINWRIREDTWTAEEFEVGSTSRFGLLQNKLQLNAQLLWAHVGGQKNRVDRVENNLTLLGGASYGLFAPLGLTGIKEIRLGLNYLYSSDDTREKAAETGDGWEVFAYTDFTPSDQILVRVHGSYFDGGDFLARRGDPLYGLDSYGQAGVVAVFALPAGFRIETGIVGQFTSDPYDDLFNYSYFMNFVWGDSFALDFLSPRRSPDV